MYFHVLCCVCVFSRLKSLQMEVIFNTSPQFFLYICLQFFPTSCRLSHLVSTGPKRFHHNQVLVWLDTLDHFIRAILPQIRTPVCSLYNIDIIQLAVGYLTRLSHSIQTRPDEYSCDRNGRPKSTRSERSAIKSVYNLMDS